MLIPRPCQSVQVSLSFCIALQVVAIRATVPPASAQEAIQSIAGLIDQDGNPYDGRSRAYAIRLVIFGYTNCPDICPTTLADVSLALSSMRADLRERVVPLFVTVDPHRDTADVLKGYLQPFGSHILGITGTVEAIDAYAWANGVYAVRNDGSDSKFYSVAHSTAVLLVSPNNSVVDRVPYDASRNELVRRIEDAVRVQKAEN